MTVFALLECWYESDGYLIDDSLAALSCDIETLIKEAHRIGRKREQKVWLHPIGWNQCSEFNEYKHHGEMIFRIAAYELK